MNCTNSTGFTSPKLIFYLIFFFLQISGIPLTLVTVANIAKFISECAFLIHYNCWKKFTTWKVRRKGSYNDDETQPVFTETDNEQVIEFLIFPFS